ncbi:MAG TPA: hypothetical protein IAB03_08545 [Candidatus Gallibacteroides avistercoris]|uniref:Uncharacterized protein n=1 Tax=Candidatus Gallibacteroides avistercoris TaxID=2840833 RepID=A0A9D1SD81_9BACT|nr:hypothetical protein [Candidatus Gallibacteroides avistercoris]
MTRLSYYYGLEAAMKAHPEGGKAGDCFVNGETCSIWMWDPVCREWTDTNRPLQSPLAGMIIDAATFCPSVHPGVRCVYLFVSGTGGTFEFPYFRNEDIPLRVVLSGPSQVWLYWNGDNWEVQVIPSVAE